MQHTTLSRNASPLAPPIAIHSAFKSPISKAFTHALVAPKQRRATALRPQAAAAPVAPPLNSGPPPLEGEALARKVTDAFNDAFFGAHAAPRVLASFHRLLSGPEHVQLHKGKGLQVAESYIEGLSAEPFPDPHDPVYGGWLASVEAAADVIKKEFDSMMSDEEALKAKGANIWVPAVREDALAYGPDWRTLVLQDRGVWDPTNSRLFPRTVKVLQDLQAPTLEVFFARQAPATGIKSHTDYVNFVQTSHLGLHVPHEGQPEGEACWIKCGDHTRQWRAGKIVTMETSFMHETRNDTDAERVVLIMRHFHPEVTPLERKAVQFLYDCMADPTAEGVRAARRKAQAAVMEGSGGKKKGGKPASSGGRGFG